MNSIAPITLVMTQSLKKWEFPRTRFFEWEPKDEWFCRKYGIGKEVEVSSVLTIPNFIITGIDHKSGEISVSGAAMRHYEDTTS